MEDIGVCLATADIFTGNCGFTTTVDATMSGKVCKLTINSEYTAIRKMEELTEVDPQEEISFKRGLPEIHEAGHKFCTHAACPVPAGIIKAVEIEAKQALPTDARIRLSKTKEE